MAYIAPKSRNPFGDDFDEEILKDAGRDSTFLDGYSDRRIERELAIRKGDNVAPLPFRFHLARAKSLDGQRADGRRMFHWDKKGYKPVKWDAKEFQRLGIDPQKNPAFYKGEDGNVYNGGNMLTYADAKTAAANYLKVQREQERAETASADRMRDAGERYAAATGGDSPTFAVIEDPVTGKEVGPQRTSRK